MIKYFNSGEKVFFIVYNTKNYGAWEMHSGIISSFSPAEGLYCINFVNPPVPYPTNRGFHVCPEYIYKNREQALEHLESMHNQRISTCKKTIKDMLEIINYTQKLKKELVNNDE